MHVMGSAPNARAVIDGREVDYFCGTGYFGLHGNEALVNAACDATRQYGLGSATSRAGYGNNPVLLEVEERAARFFQAESSIYYLSGYMGNAILLQGLAAQYDVIFMDSDSHYSVIDGAAMANKPVIHFQSRDPEDLKRKLATELKPSQRPLVICDGIYPSDGAIAPLREYDEVLSNYDNTLLLTDDAHAVGVIGEKGHGSFEYCGLQGPTLYTSGTLSKAFGGFGGVIAGSQELITTLKANANVLKAASPPPVPAAAATAKALELVTNQPEIRQQLWDNVKYTKDAFRALGFDNIPGTPVPVVALSPKGIELSKLQQELSDQGVVTAYMPGGFYTGVPESGLIRFSIFATHSKAQIDRLVDAIKTRI